MTLVNAQHITASVFINDDESGLHHDYEVWLERLAPHAPIDQYWHTRAGEDNADAHLKRQVMGREVVVAVTNGRLDFGTWERIFYGEFDGRRRKEILSPEEISWKDARANIGTTAKVCGEAVTVAIFLDGRTVVNLGETPDKGGVIVVVTDSTIFPEDELKGLYGKNICVTGEITQEESNIGIFVTDPAQIEMNE